LGVNSETELAVGIVAGSSYQIFADVEEFLLNYADLGFAVLADDGLFVLAGQTDFDLDLYCRALGEGDLFGFCRRAGSGVEQFVAAAVIVVVLELGVFGQAVLAGYGRETVSVLFAVYNVFFEVFTFGAGSNLVTFGNRVTASFQH